MAIDSFRPSFWDWACGEEGACAAGFRGVSVLCWLPFPPVEPSAGRAITAFLLPTLRTLGISNLRCFFLHYPPSSALLLGPGLSPSSKLLWMAVVSRSVSEH